MNKLQRFYKDITTRLSKIEALERDQPEGYDEAIAMLDKEISEIEAQLTPTQLEFIQLDVRLNALKSSLAWQTFVDNVIMLSSVDDVDVLITPDFDPTAPWIPLPLSLITDTCERRDYEMIQIYAYIMAQYFHEFSPVTDIEQ